LTTQRGFPCCVCLPLSCMPSPIPRRNHRLRFASLHLWQRPSPYNSRVGFRIGVFEACSAFTRVMACMLAKSLKDPLHQRLQPLRCLHDCPDCYRPERKLPDGIRTRWKTAPFLTAHYWLHLLRFSNGWLSELRITDRNIRYTLIRKELRGWVYSPPPLIVMIE
jgi:hypothetical protein